MSKLIAISEKLFHEITRTPLHIYQGENLAVCGAEVPDVCPECAAALSPGSDLVAVVGRYFGTHRVSEDAPDYEVWTAYRAALAAKPAEGLDVERLGAAILHHDHVIGWDAMCTEVDCAPQIAREYAARAAKPECAWCRGWEVVYACVHCGRSDMA